uniref:Uncharacterized protein n=1 Tax=Eiseniibacteriota bacterium TaxID=2212470 RepID=A0A832I1S9_UNCEI
MARRRGKHGLAQAWILLHADDPEAVSALAVARAHLAAGRALAGLRRARLFELRGDLPGREELEDLLHRSTQFYNPHKERCLVRTSPEEPTPAAAGERILLVWERGGERRPAAERWWLHETGRRIEVREGVAWLLALEPGAPARAVEALAVVGDRAHGLLVNPHAQDHRATGPEGAFPCWEAVERTRGKEPA